MREMEGSIVVPFPMSIDCGKCVAMAALRAVGERWTVSSLLERFQEAPDFASPVTRVAAHGRRPRCRRMAWAR